MVITEVAIALYVIVALLVATKTFEIFEYPFLLRMILEETDEDNSLMEFFENAGTYRKYCYSLLMGFAWPLLAIMFILGCVFDSYDKKGSK